MVGKENQRHRLTPCYMSEYKVLEKLPSPEDKRCLIQEIRDEITRRKMIEEDASLRTELIKKSYQPINPHIFKLKESFLNPEFIQLVEKSSVCVGKEEVFSDLDVISTEKQLYGFPVFTEEFCESLLTELENFENASLPKGRPNSMNRHGVLLDELGFYKNFLDPLRIQFLNSLSKLLFPEWCGDSLDSHRAFTVKYELGEDEDIDYHYDNAEVTLNVCLGKDFAGGELYFGGMKSASTSEPSYISVPHKIGYGLLHRGQQLHGTMPITSGERQNMIVWMRSSSVRNTRCPMCDSLPDLIPSKSYGDGFTSNIVSACCMM